VIYASGKMPSAEDKNYIPYHLYVLSAVYCLLFSVCLLSIVCCLLFPSCCLLSAVCRLPMIKTTSPTICKYIFQRHINLWLHCGCTSVTLRLHCFCTINALLLHCRTLLSHCCHTVITLLLHRYRRNELIEFIPIPAVIFTPPVLTPPLLDSDFKNNPQLLTIDIVSRIVDNDSEHNPHHLVDTDCEYNLLCTAPRILPRPAGPATGRCKTRTAVTLLSNCCYTVVTQLSHSCHTVFTLLLLCCYTVFTLLLLCCNTVVALLLLCCYTVVALLLHRNVRAPLASSAGRLSRACSTKTP
jgi:hypothetical protein